MLDAQPPTAPRRPGRAALSYRDFRLYQGARTFTIMGAQMQSVAIGWEVYAITHRPLDLGLVGLAQFLPFILLSLVGGHAADRYDRRRIMIVCYAIAAFGQLLLFGLSYFGNVRTGPIYAVLALLGAMRAFSAPASSALTPHLVPAEDFPNAIAWVSAFRQISVIVGPALGGLLYSFLGGASTVYATSVGMNVVALAMLLSMRIRTGRLEPQAASLGTVLAGVRFVWAKPLLLGSMSLDLFAVLFGGAVALLPIYARDILHIGPSGLGVLRSAPAVGAGLMALSVARWPMTSGAGKKMLWCVALFGVATIVFGLSKSFALSVVMLVVLGATDMVSVVVRLTLEQIATPAAMRGRVSAVNMMFIGASNELGEFESGITAAWFGAVPAVVLGGVATCAVVGLWSLWFPALRQVERLDAPPV